MTCDRKHLTTGVLVLDWIAGEEHLLYGFKMAHPRGYAGWEFPGGKQEGLETIAETAIRETWEETGLWVRVKPLAHFEHNWFCTFFLGIPVDGELELREPSKHREWRWCPLEEPPNPLLWYCRDGIKLIGERHDLNIRQYRH